MSITGLPGQGPVRVGIPVADLTAGIFCAMGILVALLEREQSGEGQWVQSNLLAAQIAMLDFQAARWTIGHEVPGQAGNDHPTSIPTGVFATADGYMNIGAAGEAIYRRFCKVHRCAGTRDRPGLRHQRGSLEEPRAAERGDRRDHPQAHHGRMDRSAERGRRAVRPDLPDERGVRRSAGAAPQHHAPRAAQGAGRRGGGRPGGRTVAHAVERAERRRRSRASIPTRCWANWAMARRTSRGCASRR